MGGPVRVIQAVEWTLCGVATGRKAFPVRVAPKEGEDAPR